MASDTASRRESRPQDFLDIDSLLSDEERAIRDVVRAFVNDRVVPDVGDWFEQGHDPARARSRARCAERARHASGGVRLRRRERDRLRARVPGARGR